MSKHKNEIRHELEEAFERLEHELREINEEFEEIEKLLLKNERLLKELLEG